MILVDSSVWIEFFRGTITPQTTRLDQLLNSRLLSTGDLILTEVLRGFTNEGEAARAKVLLTSHKVIELAGRDIALKAAENYRFLRGQGITIRSAIDTIIATKCIADGLVLLHSDRDFEPFVTHLGLQVVV